jgi:nitrogen regulatory protein PII
MNELKEIKAIVRNDSVPDLIHALKGAEITRFFVSRIHALGAGAPATSIENATGPPSKSGWEEITGRPARAPVVR